MLKDFSSAATKLMTVIVRLNLYGTLKHSHSCLYACLCGFPHYKLLLQTKDKNFNTSLFDLFLFRHFKSSIIRVQRLPPLTLKNNFYVSQIIIIRTSHIIKEKWILICFIVKSSRAQGINNAIPAILRWKTFSNVLNWRLFVHATLINWLIFILREWRV